MRMQRLSTQAGASMIFWLVVIAAVGFAITIGLRLFPVYLHAYTVDSILKDVVNEARATDRSPEQIWASIDKRLDINDIDDIKRENFSYKNDKGVITVAIRYEDRTELVGNLDAVAKFEHVQTMTEKKPE
jgi:hypothetical protein